MVTHDTTYQQSYFGCYSISFRDICRGVQAFLFEGGKYFVRGVIWFGNCAERSTKFVSPPPPKFLPQGTVGHQVSKYKNWGWNLVSWYLYFFLYMIKLHTLGLLKMIFSRFRCISECIQCLTK